MDYYEMLYGHRLLQSNRKYSNILHNFHKEKQQNYDSEPESDQSEGAMQKKHFFNDFLDDMGSKIKMKSSRNLESLLICLQSMQTYI